MARKFLTKALFNVKKFISKRKMSPELNSIPPVLVKRKKKQREKKHSSTSKINDFGPPAYSCFQSNLNSYPNIALNDSYYSFPSYQLPTEPMSLPIYPPTYQNVHLPVNLNCNSSVLTNKSFKTHNQSDNNEYMSLPVQNGEQNDDTGQRRFSDPGFPNDSDSSYNSADSQIIQKLTQQITILKEGNRKLSREVTELRMELNMLKQQQHAKHFDRDYEPGMISDMIREIRDAARVREDALLAKVKHMVEEKQFRLSQFHLASEKNRNNDRLSKLEEQMKTLNINTSRSEDNISLPSTSILDENSGSARQVFELEREALLLRRELQDARAKKEESDQKILQLDKRLSNLLRPKDFAVSETSDDGSKTSISTVDTMSVTTQSSIISQSPHRITLSGPVTDL